jgi:flagellar hook-associated protein 3 FlgL
MMRIATFSQSSRLLSMAMSDQAKLAETQRQVASGLKTETYADLGTDATRAVSLASMLESSKARQEAETLVSNRVQTMHAAVGDMVDLLSQARVLVSGALDGNSSDAEVLVAQAQGLLDDMVALMNSRQEGRYLFGGTATEAAPVDVSAMTVPTVPSTADTSYYQGSDTLQSLALGSGASVTYGVSAGTEPFEQAVRALNLLANLTTTPSPDTAAMSEAYDLATEALDGLTAVQGNLSIAAERIESDLSRESASEDLIQQSFTDLTAVDVAQATVELENRKTLLEASYAAIAKIADLTLSDYLR